MKRDIKRQKLAEAKNVPGLVERVNQMNSTALRRRTKMMLPAPQVGSTSFLLMFHAAAKLLCALWALACQETCYSATQHDLMVAMS